VHRHIVGIGLDVKDHIAVAGPAADKQGPDVVGAHVP